MVEVANEDKDKGEGEGEGGAKYRFSRGLLEDFKNTPPSSPRPLSSVDDVGLSSKSWPAGARSPCLWKMTKARGCDWEGGQAR